MSAGIGMAVNSAACIAQYFGWHFVPTITPYAGLYFQRNIGAETAAMIMVWLIGYRMWWLAAGCLPTLFFGSRAATLAVAVALGMMLWRKSRIAAVAAFTSISLAISAIWVVTNYWSSVKLDGDAHASAVRHPEIFASDLLVRIHTWYDAIHGFTFFGRGLGSFMVEFPRWQNYTSSLNLRWENAHNDPLQLTFELGIGGVILISLFAIRMAYAPRRPEFYALVAFVVEGLFGFPLYQPVTGVFAALCAGCLFGHCDPLRSDLLRVGHGVRIGYARTSTRVLRAICRPVPADAGKAPGVELVRSGEP
jgi:hypothetical protein